ncbi:MAG: hypothetical protein DMG81_12270 [Acidobacteria bacterium]|nr:MAG: hypothetical protein DMG81_12270 [Acidobacteriota bacterium]
MWITAFLLHRSTNLIVEYGDNYVYLAVANALRRWDFSHMQIQHFMGYPYFIAGASVVFRIPTALALWLIAVVSSLASVWLAARLFGTITWVVWSPWPWHWGWVRCLPFDRIAMGWPDCSDPYRSRSAH